MVMHKNHFPPQGLAKLANLAKENLEAVTTQTTYHGHALADLRAAAHPDEWDEIKDKPEVLEVFARSLLESRQIDAGVIPERFTNVARCSGCGAVFVPTTWPTERRETRLGQYAVETWDEAESCPWCRLRVQGKCYPKVHPADEEGRPLPRPITWQGKEERSRNWVGRLTPDGTLADTAQSTADDPEDHIRRLPSPTDTDGSDMPIRRGQILMASTQMAIETTVRLCA